MGQATRIQWCDSTVNPTGGCDGCELRNRNTNICYAGRINDRFEGTQAYPTPFEKVILWPGRVAKAAAWSDLTGKARPDKPWLDGLPRLIFVSDMSDALSKPVPFDFLETEIIPNVTGVKGRRHHWLWLTKQPLRMAEFSGWLQSRGIAWPKNLWAGTSITTQGTTGRIEHLLRVGDEHTLRFLSVEPQWERLDLGRWLPQLDWVIQGGESGGEKARPFRLGWADALRKRCRAACIAYFLKQLGSVVFSKGQRLHLRDGHGGDWDEWSERLRVQEMPVAAVAR
jgi:protein gp37